MPRIPPLVIALLVIAACTDPRPIETPHDTVLLFSFFRGNGEAGLFLASSEDGLRWQEVRPGHAWLAPKVGTSVLMRDPCIIRGVDGRFHMVWTPGWNEQGIGYASSADLITWSDQQYLPVMAHEPTARNAWAPEAFYDAATAQYFIFWASTIPGRFSGTDQHGDDGYNHRVYYTTTKDFVSFDDTRLFYDPGFSVIDSTIVWTGERYVMFLKNETLTPPEKNIRLSTADRLTGPWTTPSAPVTGADWAEGPSAVFWRGQWHLYFDRYRVHRYGVMTSADLTTWTDASDRLAMPDGVRHGTAVAVPRSVLEEMRRTAGAASTAP